MFHSRPKIHACYTLNNSVLEREESKTPLLHDRHQEISAHETRPTPKFVAEMKPVAATSNFAPYRQNP